MTDRAATAPAVRRRPSLTWQIVLVTFAVSLVAVLVTALVSVQVVQRVEEDQARQQLKTQAAALVASGRTGGRLAVLGDRFAVVGPDGSVAGPASASVSREVVRELRAGRTVSTTTTLGGKEAVLVAIPGADGGGIVGVRRVADIAAGNAQLLRGILLALAIGLVVATLAGLLLARLIARPLRGMADRARAIAAGRRGVPIPPQPGEVEDIARALRTLDEALSTSEERQREFLLSVSHEIRTPLTAIRGYAEALADGVVPSSEVAAAGRTLTAESDRLRRFLDDLLELARLEADDFAIVPQSFDARDTVQAVAEAWAGAFARAGVVLRTAAETPLPVHTDEMRLRQVVDGLIENALRVAPMGTEIVVRGTASPGRVDLEVRDSGPGLSGTDPEVAFDRGALHERYRGARPVGTGLGLSIAHRLVGRLGGTITAAPADGGGAVFRVSLPSSDIPRAEP
ncbi:sensor histidine kinase [Leifsonia sp. AG29]|uniref:sensor histidine kinase n=1 Tax=Leifsonia sp. AG29 TaxID=2598860 RepID=UPI00131A8DCE|nr:HAMP domain-containing sensor histidine kinase [Leifsonia sp. AG29]